MLTNSSCRLMAILPAYVLPNAKNVGDVLLDAQLVSSLDVLFGLLQCAVIDRALTEGFAPSRSLTVGTGSNLVCMHVFSRTPCAI